MSSYKVVREHVEHGIGSKGRLRILGALADAPRGALCKYAIERRTGIRMNFLASNLMALIETGWVVDQAESDRINGCSLNYQNRLLSKVLDFLRSVGYISCPPSPIKHESADKYLRNV